MNFNTLEENVVNWAKERKIIPNAKAKVQLIKTLEEIGETAAAYAKGKEAEFVDGIGDVAVTLIIANALQKTPTTLPERFVSDSTDVFENFGFISANVGYALAFDKCDLFDENAMVVCFNALHALAEIHGYTIEYCLEKAYNAIKDRKGILTEEGVFVKEEDVRTN